MTMGVVSWGRNKQVALRGQRRLVRITGGTLDTQSPRELGDSRVLHTSVLN